MSEPKNTSTPVTHKDSVLTLQTKLASLKADQQTVIDSIVPVKDTIGIHTMEFGGMTWFGYDASKLPEGSVKTGNGKSHYYARTPRFSEPFIGPTGQKLTMNFAVWGEAPKERPSATPLFAAIDESKLSTDEVAALAIVRKLQAAAQ